MRLLLVDDSRAIRLENQRALEHAGYEVVYAEDGEAALRIAREQTIDLILLDMMLPRMSGLDVLKELKNDPKTAGIPVVVLSGLSCRNRNRLLESGADEYLEKNTLMPRPGENLLPKVLEDLICRINRRKGISFAQVHTSH